MNAQAEEEISDPKLKAEIGSLSPWSYKSSFSYQGGSLERPLAETRPDYLSSFDSNPAVSLYYNFSLKYRVDEKSDLLLGSGFLAEKSFHRSLNDLTQNNLSFSDPYLNWVHSGVWSSLQMISSISLTAVTERFEIETLKALSYLTFAQTVLKSFGRFSLSASFYFTQDVYSDRSDFYQFNGVDYRKVDHSLSVSPAVDYSLSDQLSLRTSFNFFQYQKLKGQNNYGKTLNSQSFGVGYSPARSFYVFPNLQFVPEDFRPERTNLSLFFYLNLF